MVKFIGGAGSRADSSPDPKLWFIGGAGSRAKKTAYSREVRVRVRVRVGVRVGV